MELNHQILAQALHKLSDIYGISAKIEAESVLLGQNKRFDALVSFSMGKNELPFVVDVKKEVKAPQEVLSFIEQAKQLGRPMIVAKRISKSVAHHLMKNQVAYVDLEGHHYLPLTSEQGIWNQDKASPRYRASISAPSIKGYPKVLFYLLTEPPLVKATFREISEKVGVSLGAIHNSFRRLKEQGFLIETSDHERALRNTDRLTERWVVMYINSVRPKFLVNCFSKSGESDDPRWWKEVKLSELSAQWGGEVAGYYLTNYLQPEDLIVYAKDRGIAMVRKCRLRPDPKGNIYIFDMFWELFDQEPSIAPPLIAYADLMSTHNTRNIETAKMIFEKCLQKKNY